MNDELEKMKLHSPDWANENIRKLAEIFPNCVTETQDADGKIKSAIDYDQLRQELSDHIVDGPQERYHLNWPGKREALLAANAPIAKTLRPARDESVNFDTTQNLFIEGDNLDALKLLQETYLGKVKMIYIDPPYNTGNDFIYEDDFAESADEFLERSNQRDEDGNRLVANPEGRGRFHSTWLSMITSRLKVSKNLLSDDGVLFISINDTEQANLRKVCEEIFGHDNIVGQITWKARVKPVNIGDAKYRPQKEIEYVLVIQKTHNSNSFFPISSGNKRSYPHELSGRKYRLTTILKSNRGTNERSTMSFRLGDYSPPEGQRWQAGEEAIHQLYKENYIEFKNGTPFRRYFEDEEGEEHSPFYCFMETEHSSTSEAGKLSLNELLGQFHNFDTVKPVKLLETLIKASTDKSSNHLVLDFFAGSGTTGDAVLRVNALDGGDRKFILNQIPEPCLSKNAEGKLFENIANLTKERIRLVGDKILEGDCHPDWNKDIGFRVLKVDTSNMKDVYYRPDEVDQSDLLSSVDNIKPDRGGEDLLFQVLVDWGVDLTLPIRHEKVDGKSVYLVDDDTLIACFETGINVDFVKQLATHKPLRVVFRDNGFASDDVKANVAQIFRQTSPDTDIKVI